MYKNNHHVCDRAPQVKKAKRPYAIALAGGGFMALAGLWENWKSPDGERVRSFTIVTTVPNELCATIHDAGDLAARDVTGVARTWPLNMSMPLTKSL